MGGELLEYETAAGDHMSVENKKMCLEDLCPLELQKHLAEEAHRLKTYAQMKQEIDDYLYDAKRCKKGGSVRCVQDHHDDQPGCDHHPEGAGYAGDDQEADRR